ncbi:MAG TPA: ribose-5-phosphate isomerase RpiA [Candidatus Bathyarchaeota archaeon]|nr:ribose-5-phosphate isomerase RpiA [Candidatus Bathyarchaeota archaeon]
MSWREEAKKRVALEAVKHVEDGFVVGLGSGSTAAYVIAEIGRMIRQDGLGVLGVPSSSQAFLLAVQSGVPLTTLDEHPVLDLDIDGADEVDRRLNLIKGGGGALTQEKIVASAAKKVVIVADETKLVEKLGSTFKVPVEVLPFGLATATAAIKKLGGKPLLRESKGKVGAVVTDNGNYIVDVDFGPISDAGELNRRLKLIPGVIETGLFIGIADIVYLGKADGIVKLEK